MDCPKCHHANLSVLEKRDIVKGIRRRRICNKCKYRFTTYERYEIPQLIVIKKNGIREQYNEQKLSSGIATACKNLPIHPKQISDAVASITNELRTGNQETITTNLIGDLVLKQLLNINQVAYLRFISVHQSYPDIESFQNEIKKLVKVKTHV